MLTTVSEAAIELDQVTPNWYKRINTAELQMSSTTYCVLGQVYGHYDTGITKLGISFDPENYSERSLFCTYKEEWIDEINARLASDVEDGEYLLIQPDGTVLLMGVSKDKIDIVAEALSNAGVGFNTYKLVK